VKFLEQLHHPEEVLDSDRNIHGAYAIQDGIDESSDDSDDDMAYMGTAPTVPSVSGQSVMIGNVKVSWKSANIGNEDVSRNIFGYIF